MRHCIGFGYLVLRVRKLLISGKTEIEGIDIMLAIDVSTSMLAEDLKPNRLEAAKDVAAEFINGRPNDNIGITYLPEKHSLNVR